ncbi:hypothetical protein ACFQMA_10465 [Halosimplex aquaticum]|uniref:Uncharacterized protein n=1 Tax=Halosimplex aquaticum TaxID=3026162 RepID=A0ABD5Y010_9EURY|nr:hypothetical protein [Halosimplex aquaticum]
MAHSTRETAWPWPSGTGVLAAAVALEGVLVVGYFLATPGEVTVPRYVLYPFVWINAVLVAAYRTPISQAPRRRHLLAGALAAVYFLLLANWAGLVGLTVGGHHPIPESVLGLSVGSGSPGWGRVRLITRVFYVSFVPYRVIGYLGLTYLVYAAILDASGAVASGALGLVSCLSCSFPVLASFATGFLGGWVTLMSTAVAYSVDVSTAAFLASVALLYWRPGFPSVGYRSDDSE